MRRRFFLSGDTKAVNEYMKMGSHSLPILTLPATDFYRSQRVFSTCAALLISADLVPSACEDRQSLASCSTMTTSQTSLQTVGMTRYIRLTEFSSAWQPTFWSNAPNKWIGDYIVALNLLVVLSILITFEYHLRKPFLEAQS